MRYLGGSVAAALVAGLLISVPASADMASPRALALDEPVRMQLVPCINEADRDCIESLGMVAGRTFIAGELVSLDEPKVTESVTPGTGESGPTTGRMVLHPQTWRIPGLRTEVGNDTLTPFIAITTPGLRWYAADSDSEYDVTSQVEFELFSEGIVEVSATRPCMGGDGTCYRPSRIAPGQPLRAVIRTSWFQPSWARSHLRDTVLRVEPLAGGGSRITVEGEALNSPGFFFGGGRNPDTSQREEFDFYDYRWTVYMLDANDPNFPSACANFGFPLISGNQWGSGTPTWNPRTQEMDLQMSAPHRDGDGKVFRGHYEAFIPSAYARCLWRTDPKRLQSRLIVEVTSEDGEEKAATTSIGMRNGGVRIIARNFSLYCLCNYSP